jgi:hypothetical protein
MNRALPLLIAAALLLVAASVTAATPDDDTVPGELRVSSNSEWVKAEVNGEPWDSVEYENRGKRMLIKGIDRGPAMISFKLIPTDQSLAPVTLEVPSKAFKRQVNRRVLYYIAKRIVKFKKRSDAPPPEPETEPEPEKKPEKVTPERDPDEL